MCSPRAQLTLWLTNLEKLKIEDIPVEKEIINNLISNYACSVDGCGIKFSHSIYKPVFLGYLDEHVRVVGGFMASSTINVEISFISGVV